VNGIHQTIDELTISNSSKDNQSLVPRFIDDSPLLTNHNLS